MKQVRSVVRILVGMVVVLGVGAFVVVNYSWVFSKRVKGKIVDVQRVTDPSAVLGGQRVTAEQLHSYSVLIEGEDHRLYTSSSEDRQWQVAAKGYCVEALLYRYPPWDLKNAGTFFNARLVELKVCDGQSAVAAPPVEVPPPPANPSDK